MRYWLIVPAAGSGRRFGASSPKQYAPLEGRTVLEWALSPFIGDARCAGMVIALAAGDREWPQVAARLRSQAPQLSAVVGGEYRSLSVRQALEGLAGRAAPDDWVLVHDAARPCLAAEDLERLLEAVAAHATGGLLASPAADTLKRSASGPGAATPAGVPVAATVDRSTLWRALTPQMFRYGTLRAALDAAHAAGRFPTDEAEALEWQGEQPLLVAAAASNLKVTTPDDLLLAAAILRARHRSNERTQMRIGSGFDVHAFGPGEFVMLGGVRIAHSHGVIAHSDGDVVLHALCDALLGAAGLGDIGQHFQDTDPRWRGADSRHFVREVRARLGEQGLGIANVDITVLAQSPKVAPHREAMRVAIAALLEIGAERVNIKATTTEGLGFLGRAEGIAAQAIVLLADGAPWPPRS
ncbi:MAG: 2-C-methyl-D-erythritol 4-phosphate cytidylyltransferase [Gammaproteobacteria bacterium]|nr:2-C-methyl-D-erythritol 4-phosphate cytidylyltransferase [Gammaproteobacteria bacterium]